MRSPVLAGIIGALRAWTVAMILRCRCLADNGLDAEVGVPQLALNDVERAPSWASSTAWAWRSWWGAKRRCTPALPATRRSWARAASLAQGRPRVGPSTTHSSGPMGRRMRDSSQGQRCSQPHGSMPTSRRRPPLPWRTSTAPPRGSGSCSARVSASWMRSPARQRRSYPQAPHRLHGDGRSEWASSHRVRRPGAAGPRGADADLNLGPMTMAIFGPPGESRVAARRPIRSLGPQVRVGAGH
jgi:hypothetical protein